MFVKILPNVRQRRQKNLENSWTQAVEVTLILPTISISCGNLNVKREKKRGGVHVNDYLHDTACSTADAETFPMFPVSKARLSHLLKWHEEWTHLDQLFEYQP